MSFSTEREERVVGVTVAQPKRRVTFVYPPWGPRVVDELPVTTSSMLTAPTYGAEAAALHARLRSHPACRIGAPMRNEAAS